MSGAYASEGCQEKMLNGHDLDSKAFIISDIFEGLDIEAEIKGRHAEMLVGYFIDSLQCLAEDKNLSLLELKGTCRNIEVGNFLSKTCYVHSKIGYFIITFNMLEGAHLIYNRFD